MIVGSYEIRPTKTPRYVRSLIDKAFYQLQLSTGDSIRDFLRDLQIKGYLLVSGVHSTGDGIDISNPLTRESHEWMFKNNFPPGSYEIIRRLH